MQKILLKPAEIGDVNTIAAIHALCWQETYCFMPTEVLNSRNKSYRLCQWESWFKNPGPNDALYKLIVGELIVGFCFCKSNDDEVVSSALGEMHAAYILPEYRGGVVGPLMMLEMARFLNKRKLTPVVLWAFEQNMIRRWYAQLGWRSFIFRDRIIDGHAIPEVGYIHKDINALISRLEKIVNRHSFSLTEQLQSS